MIIGGRETIAPAPPFPTGEPGFIEDLKTWDPRMVHWDFNEEIPAESLYLVGSWQINRNFPDPEKLLDTAYAALERFVAGNIPTGDKTVKVFAVCDSSLTSEEYKVEVSADGITLTAADTEGMRRALYYFIDMCRSAEIPALRYQSVARTPWLKNRISRCFFGPIKRPPFNHDELTDNIDYYPEPYLDRLASEGINGIWLTIVWKEIAETGFFPVDPQRNQRIEKLKRTVEKCRRYGVKVWVFCIEPASWTATNKLPEGITDMRGDEHMYGYDSFCIASENSKKYIHDTVYSIFRDTPNLGGMMLISIGERPTSCLSYVVNKRDGKQVCASRCGLTASQILDGVLSSIKQGIRDAGSDAQVLSWIYNPRPAQIPDWLFTIPESLNKDKILAFNFESGGTKSQAGSVCVGGDYWLSYIGPADRFGRMAAAAKDKCEFAAKLQVGCSHELATVPFMPVPGNLYQKYQAMKELGVSHVLQCWYFGNYPGLMNRAAGMLAFEDFKSDEDDFLKRLALPDWSESHAEKVSQMWKGFGKSYENYPLDIQFQYYGPMHDGVVWPLHLKQIMGALPRTWKPDEFPAGDAIGECLVNHTLGQSVIMTGLLASGWSEALKLLPELRSTFSNDPARMRDCDLYEALDLLFNSGARIMAFYEIRQALFTAPAGCHELLKKMRDIVDAEKAASLRMVELCESDSRLGYHSEAEIFKFYPEKLKWRVNELEKLYPVFDFLADKTPEEIRELLAWEGPVFKAGEVCRGQHFGWKAELDGMNVKFIINIDQDSLENTREAALIFMDSKGISCPINIWLKNPGSGFLNQGDGITVENHADGSITVIVPLSKVGYTREIFAGVGRMYQAEDGKEYIEGAPVGNGNWEGRLNISLCFADNMCKVILG